MQIFRGNQEGFKIGHVTDDDNSHDIRCVCGEMVVSVADFLGPGTDNYLLILGDLELTKLF